MHAQFRIAQVAADQGVERIVLALGMAAQISTRAVLAGFAIDAGGLVVGVAHAGCREPREPRFEVGAQFRGRDQLADAHPVGSLAAPGESPLTRAIGLGEFPVRVEPQRASVRHLFQLVGPQFRRLPGQKPFGLFHRIDRYGVGQVANEGLNHPHVLAIEQAIAPYLRRGRQLGRELLAGESQAGRKLFGFAQPAAGLGAADPQPVGDHLVDRAADVGGILFGEARDHVVTQHSLPAA